MNVSAKVTSKGQITLPAPLRRDLKLQPGDQVDFRKNKQGNYELVAKTMRFEDLRGIIKLGRSVKTSEIDKWVKEARAARGRRS